ncbi:MAG: SRPBCC domain-containing protein [Chloroflexota bacterium]|jgi:activator of HSP90 ATPase
MTLKATIDYSIEIPVYPERVYRAWLDSGEHSRFSGAAAHIEARTGGEFRALGGRVASRLTSLVPHERIEQTWQVEGLPLEQDSRITLRLEPTCTGCELNLRHQGLPAASSRALLAWWEQVYLRPLRAYFDALVGEYAADMGDG